MSAAKEILNKVKAAFFGEPVVAPAVEPLVLATSKVYKLQDGTEITVSQAAEEVAIGDSVTVGALPTEGVYMLEDGSSIVVDATGMITELKPAEPVTVILEDTPPTVEERLAAIESTLKQLAQPSMPTGLATEAQYNEALSKIEKQSEVIKGLFELAEKLVEQPSAEPVTLTGNRKEQFERTQKKDQKLERFAKALQETKTGNHAY